VAEYTSDPYIALTGIDLETTVFDQKNRGADIAEGLPGAHVYFTFEQDPENPEKITEVLFSQTVGKSLMGSVDSQSVLDKGYSGSVSMWLKIPGVLVYKSEKVAREDLGL
jgi:hypothetical protein